MQLSIDNDEVKYLGVIVDKQVVVAGMVKRQGRILK